MWVNGEFVSEEDMRDRLKLKEPLGTIICGACWIDGTNQQLAFMKPKVQNDCR